MSDYLDLSLISNDPFNYCNLRVDLCGLPEETSSLHPAHGPWSAVGYHAGLQIPMIDPALTVMQTTGPILNGARQPPSSMRIVPSHVSVISDMQDCAYGSISNATGTNPTSIRITNQGNACLPVGYCNHGYQLEMEVNGQVVAQDHHGPGMEGLAPPSSTARPQRRGHTLETALRRLVFLLQPAVSLRNKRSDSSYSSSRPEVGVFKCTQEGCKYMGTFKRKAELMRHVNSIHKSPHSYICPDKGCSKPFNRKDNLRQHVMRRHNSKEEHSTVH